MVQWLGCCPFNAEDVGSVPGQGAKIPHSMTKKNRLSALPKFRLSFTNFQKLDKYICWHMEECFLLDEQLYCQGNITTC